MRPRLFFACALCCLFLLGGCASKNVPMRSASRFPEQPVGILAAGPEQGLVGSADRGGVTVNGGWGFKKADAMILTAPAGSRRKIHNTVPLERSLVLARNEVEFTLSPPAGRRYAVLDYGTVSRTLSDTGGRMYAVWRGQARLLYEADNPRLFQEAASRPLPRRGSMTPWGKERVVSREYWFDITDTFGARK